MLALAMGTASVIVPFVDYSVMLVRLASTALKGDEHDMWFFILVDAFRHTIFVVKIKKGTVFKAVAHGYDWGWVCFFQRSEKVNRPS